MDETLLSDLDDAVPVLRRFIGDDRPVAGIVLGSGLNPFAETLDDARTLDYADVPHMACSTASGHVGRFVIGRLPASDIVVLCMQGRLHRYEGNSAAQVAFPVWCMAACGIEALVTTNAAGAIDPDFAVGDFCVMSDLINFTGSNPLVGVEPDRLADRFVPMVDCFDPQLVAAVSAAAERIGVPVHTGVYLGLLGPSFETPAEIRMFSSWGAQTVAMSVVEEVIAARHRGMRVFGCSLITNMASGVEGGNPIGADIMDVATTRQDQFARLIDTVVRTIADDASAATRR